MQHEKLEHLIHHFVLDPHVLEEERLIHQLGLVVLQRDPLKTDPLIHLLEIGQRVVFLLFMLLDLDQNIVPLLVALGVLDLLKLSDVLLFEPLGSSILDGSAKEVEVERGH